MQKVNILLFLVFIGHICIGQSVIVDSLFNEFRAEIVKQENDEQEIFGNRIHLDDKLKLRYYSFLHEASIDELLEYMNDSNPAIRCLIFSGLVGKGAKREFLEDIASDYKNDTADVKHLSSSVANGSTVYEHISTYLKWLDQYPDLKIDYSSRIEKIKSQRAVVINGANYYDEISVAALSKLDSIYCPDKIMKIIQFEMFAAGQSYQSESNHLTSEMKNALQQVAPGDKLYFEDIRVFISADSTVRKVANIGLEVK